MDNEKNMHDCMKIMNFIKSAKKIVLPTLAMVIAVFVLSILITYMSIEISYYFFDINKSTTPINLVITSILVVVTSIYVAITFEILRQSKTERVLDNIEKILINVYSPIDTMLKRYKLSYEYHQSGDSKKIPDNFNSIFMELNDELFKIQTNYGYLFKPDLILYYNNAWKIWRQYLGSEDIEKKKTLVEQLNGDINILHDFITQQINAEKKKKNEII